MAPTVQFRLRVYRGDTAAIGPGKVRLLEAIDAAGSISAAARRLGMSYRRAWVLVDEMNRALVAPVVSAATGGSHGGGTTLTAAGHAIVRHYRAVERKAHAAAAEDLAALTRLLAPDTSPPAVSAPEADPP
ncbi:MAG: LysR family transcriptional regulator [Xylophilus ampelinus]